MAPLKSNNSVNPLTWNVPITNPNGTPTDEFMRKWNAQAAYNSNVANLTTAAGVSAVLDLIGSTKGSMLYRAATAWSALPGPSTDGWVLTWNQTTGLPEWRTAGAGIAAAIYIDASEVPQMALVDANGLEVLDGSGFGIYSPSFPLASASVFGIAKVDGVTIKSTAGVIAINALPAQPQPTIQTFTTVGAFTYNTPAGCVRIEVEMEAPGGGSAGVHTSGATAGGDASDCIFNGVRAGGGKGGKTSGAGGAGGKSATGAATKRWTGMGGGFAIMNLWTATNFIICGGQGGEGPSATGGGAGAAGVAGEVYGQGAAGACLANDTQANLAAFNFSGGGGQGERVFLVIAAPALSYAGTIADGGTAGTGTTFAGAKGGKGRITVREFYV